MRYRLHLSSVDEDQTTEIFDKEQDAIDRAEKWFIDGYEKETDESTMASVRESAIRLREVLSEGGEFRCNLLYEHAYIEPVQG